MRDGYISVVKHLLKKLSLDLQILKDMTCLGAQMRSEPWTVNAIGRIAVTMPHVITEREVSFVKDEWKLYQAANISKDWYIDSDTKKLKRVDHYWAKVFKSSNEYGKTKYGYLSKVVKSCLTSQNGNANAKRSLSDNKNTLTHERVNLNDKTLMALRISKEYARSCRGYNVDALSKDVVQAVQNAHRIYKKRKAEEDEEKKKLYS
ncbi:uncharacterized protein LOC124818591 [Hydra vulgaris]|uniref:uncharacterized protein LOC124818591 n=1 Tax=Hydra vulgaris TaxID=6087 RepID=UPI001F5E3BCC|nr:uncharacterized protein LOC124818591 [Hydra vulgaris]